MHSDLIERIIARRLRTIADEPAEAPYDWSEFRRRRSTRSRATVLVGRNRSLAVAASVIAAVLVAGVAIVRSNHQHAPDLAAAGNPARTRSSQHGPDRLEQARTRAIEGWLADLPHDPAVVRVGAHAAVTSLQDQIAELDDLLSAERAAGAQPSRLGALEQQRVQLVSSLAQLRYAEMLASSTP